MSDPFATATWSMGYHEGTRAPVSRHGGSAVEVTKTGRGGRHTSLRRSRPVSVTCGGTRRMGTGFATGASAGSTPAGPCRFALLPNAGGAKRSRTGS